MNPLSLLRRGDSSARRLATTQDVLVMLERIEDDVAVLRDGTRRAVLETSGISFDLRPPEAQLAIFNGYRALLNGLDFSLQLLVQSFPVDIEGYLERLAARADDVDPGMAELPALRALRDDHASFLRGLARERVLIERRFRLVIPAERASAREGERGGGLLSMLTVWRRPPVSARSEMTARATLNGRCDQLGRALMAIGLSTRRLDGDELATLWRDSLAGLRPRRARSQIDPLDASPAVSGILSPEFQREAEGAVQ